MKLVENKVLHESMKVEQLFYVTTEYLAIKFKGVFVLVDIGKVAYIATWQMPQYKRVKEDRKNKDALCEY